MLLENGRIDVFPHVEERGLVFIQFRKNKAVLSAGAFVGLIPLTPSLSIDIRPRLPVGNLGRVLDVACRSLAHVPGVHRDYKRDVLESNSVLEFLLRNLLAGLEGVLAEGLQKAYITSQHQNSQPRGRIDVLRTFRSLMSAGQVHKVVSHQFEQSVNNSENRVLKAALQYGLEAVQKSSKDSLETARRGSQIWRMIPSLVGPLKPSDIAEVGRVVQERRLSKSRSYYYSVLEVALLLLRGGGISLRESGMDHSLMSFIVNFETMFEDYLRNVLVNECGFSATVQDGNVAAKKPLFDDRADPPAQPDIVITRIARGDVVIAEVKYKEKIDRTDINQALTYALSYRARRVLLLHLAKSSRTSGLRSVGSIGGVSLEAYAFDLSATDLLREERLFAAAIFSPHERGGNEGHHDEVTRASMSPQSADQS